MTLEEMLTLIERLAEQAPAPELQAIFYSLLGSLLCCNESSIYRLVETCRENSIADMKRARAMQILDGKIQEAP